MVSQHALPTTSSEGRFKVVLIFHLEPGQADEELRRSLETGSFPNRLARQPGFVEMQLVKVSDDQTMSIQTWEAPQDWWKALEAVQADGGGSTSENRPNILVSRDFHAGAIVRQLGGERAPQETG